ncbi:MAG: hypothetical protein DRI46_06615 [Chloroflexi bacterium]|nr:MAG: hypothetical protein DRI46_06615 [Chloroflexota bacterium]
MDISVDATVRRALAAMELTHHFYIDFLVHARRGLNDLNLDVLHKLGVMNYTIDENDQIPIPDDSVGVIGVYIEVGDKIKPLYRNDKINPKEDAGAYPVVSYEEHLTDQTPALGMFKGRDFIKGLYWYDYYREIPEEQKIRIDNRYKDENVIVLYVTTPKKVDNQSLLPAMAETALFEFLVWQWSRFHADNRFDHRLNKSNYYNERRLLRARKFKLNINDYIRRIRSNQT